MTKHTDLDATAAHVKALAKILDAHTAEYIVRACNVFADVEEGVSLIARKDHYYQLEAKAKSQPALLDVCRDLLFLVGPNNTIGLSPKLINKAKAALAKATG